MLFYGDGVNGACADGAAGFSAEGLWFKMRYSHQKHNHRYTQPVVTIIRRGSAKERVDKTVYW